MASAIHALSPGIATLCSPSTVTTQSLSSWERRRVHWRTGHFLSILMQTQARSRVLARGNVRRGRRGVGIVILLRNPGRFTGHSGPRGQLTMRQWMRLGLFMAQLNRQRLSIRLRLALSVKIGLWSWLHGRRHLQCATPSRWRLIPRSVQLP